MPERGRPTVYTEEAAEEICRRLVEGETLSAICRDGHIPAFGTVQHWIADDREGFAVRYARAREFGYIRMADDITDISDDGSNDWMERNVGDGETITVADHEHISRSKLRVDTRKWLLAKVLPKIYGDRIEHVGAGGKDLLPPAEVDTQKLALALVGLLQAAKKEGG